MRFSRALVSFVLVPAFLTACGGGGGGTSATVAGLTGPDDVSVVTAEGSGSPIAAFPPDSDYVLDESDLHVYDPSMEVLGIINEILCMTSISS